MQIQIQLLLKLNASAVQSALNDNAIQIQLLLKLNEVNETTRAATALNSNTTLVKVKSKYPIKTAPILKLFKYNSC